MKENDNVNAPAHYTAGGIECIDAIQAALTPEEFRGFCKGNVLKYCWRERMKGGNESVQKAEWYMRRLLAAAQVSAGRDYDKLLTIIAYAYQVAGAHGAHERILDVLCDPEAATDEQVEAMLPYVLPDTASVETAK